MGYGRFDVLATAGDRNLGGFDFDNALMIHVSTNYVFETRPVGDVHRLLLVMGDEDRRHVHLVVKPAKPGAQVLAHLRVESAERLVEQQYLRLDRQGPR